MSKQSFRYTSFAKKGKEIPLQMVLFVWFLLQVFPLYWLLTFSLKDNAQIFSGNLLALPTKLLFSNYKEALVGAKVGLFLFNSLVVTAVTIAATLLFSMMASYTLIRMKWKLRYVAQVLFMMGLMIPIHSAILPLFLIMQKGHLLNSYLCLILPYVGFGIPMGLLIFSGFMQSIPRELEEAACMDGCSIYRTFFKIILPLLRPAASTVAIFTFLSSWNELMFATVFISEEKYKTLTVGIQSMSGRYSTEWGPIGAALVVASLPTIVIYLMMSSQVHKSLVAGAVKG